MYKGGTAGKKELQERTICIFSDPETGPQKCDTSDWSDLSPTGSLGNFTVCKHYPHLAFLNSITARPTPPQAMPADLPANTVGDPTDLQGTLRPNEAPIAEESHTFKPVNVERRSHTLHLP